MTFLRARATIAYKSATVSGGGIYAYQSELRFIGSIDLTGNTAAENGGGINAISAQIQYC